MSMKQYYTTEQYLKNRIRNIGRQMAFKAENRNDFSNWKNEVRSIMIFLTADIYGMEPYPYQFLKKNSV